MLGVDATADNAALKWAYERKLAEAARTGALRRAQELDAAYEVLRSDSRRALYDRHGVSQALPRLHPLERWAPVRPVPFRSWTPAECTAPRQPRRDSRQCRQTSTTGRWVAAVMLGLMALSWGAWAVRETTTERPPEAGQPTRMIEVRCDGTATGPAYSYLTVEGATLECTNGATSRWAVSETDQP